MEKHFIPVEFVPDDRGENIHLGRHRLIEYYDCDQEILSDKDLIENLVVSAVREARATIVTQVFHHFSPHGVSGVVVIAESHVTVHTWPEHRYAAVDIFTCQQKMAIEIIEKLLAQSLKAGKTVSLELARGTRPL